MAGVVSEHFSPVNVSTVPKQCRSLQNWTFILFFYHSNIVRFKMLGLFLNPLTANTKYSRHNMGFYCNQFKCIYLEDQKPIVNMLLNLQNLTSNFEHLLKKFEPHSLSVFEIIHSKERGYLKHTTCYFKTSLGSQRVSGSQTLQKSEKENVYPTFPSFWQRERESWETPLLVRYEIFGLFFNPLTADAKYSCQKMWNSSQHIQIHLS